MGKLISNADIIDMFKNIDEFRKNSGLSQDKIDLIEIEKQDEIIKKLSFLVYHQAKQYRGFPNYDDIVQEGFIGLLKAVRRFEWERFPNFFIFSEQWIRHYIKRAASRFDVVYSPNKSRVIYAEPDENEIDESDGPEEILFTQERKESISKVLGEFSKRDREIVQKIFGLDQDNSQTLREVGPQFNLSYERVRQIKNNILNKLKKNEKMNELNQ